MISVALPSTLDRSDAAAFRGQVLVAFEQSESMAIEAATVGPLPALWMQLLLSAAKSAAERGQRIVLRDPSPACLGSFGAIGIDLSKTSLGVE